MFHQIPLMRKTGMLHLQLMSVYGGPHVAITQLHNLKAWFENQKLCIIFSPHPSRLCMKEGSSSYWTSPMFSMTRIAVYENFLAGLNVLIGMLSDIVNSTPQIETLRERERDAHLNICTQILFCFVLSFVFVFFCIAILQGIIIISHPSLKWYRFS